MNRLINQTIKFFSAKKDPSNTRDEFYLNRIYFKRLLFFFSSFKKSQQSSQIFFTSETLSPLGLKFGSAEKQVLAQMGTPSFTHHNQYAGELRTHIFRKKIANLSLLLQVQFYNDSLFFIAIDAAKTLKSDSDKTDILNTVIEKYLNKPFRLGDNYPIIQDGEGNFIIINDDVYFSICYLQGSQSNAQDFLKHLIENPLRKPKEKKEKESLFYTF